MKSYEDFRSLFDEAAKNVTAGAERAARFTKLTLSLEAEKAKLAKLYEKIGEAVVSGTISENAGDGQEELFRLIDEAKAQKRRIRELSEEKSSGSSKTTCRSCGAPVKKGEYCAKCGTRAEI